MKIFPSAHHLGARIEGLDLSKPLSTQQRDEIIQLLGKYGLLNFSGQQLEAADLKHFSSHFGELEINVANAYQEPGHPEVMILSNMVVDGKPVGIADAGQGWHTDMSYSRTVAFANVLYGIRIPHRNGRPLGGTTFSDMQAAYDELPETMKLQLEGLTGLHDYAKFYDMMRNEKNSPRPPLTDAQRSAKPPVSHPIVLTHPITKRKVLYANPGYTIRINELSEQESEKLLTFLFEHQVQDRFVYTFEWTPGDVLIWDNLRTIHQAYPDYTADEHRLIKRCQVMATLFDIP
ncbi:MAG: TauD/TfdA family dioxygenase [Pigmentiphaga sp.]